MQCNYYCCSGENYFNGVLDNKSRNVERVYIELLHRKAKLLSMQERWQKQFLLLMYLYSKEKRYYILYR